MEDKENKELKENEEIKESKESKKITLVVGTGIGVVGLDYIGGMFNYFPFLADDLAIRAIGFSTLIICLVIAVCTCVLMDYLDKK